MNSFMDKYFGPLPREYCVYFYVLSIIFGTVFAIVAISSSISLVYFILKGSKKVNMMIVANTLLILLNTFLAYISNRLLHTMCVKSI